MELGKSLVAGPIHPSFKEMVLSDLWCDLLNEKQLKKGKNTIHVAEKQLNYAIGYKGKNRNTLQSNGYDVKFVSDSALKEFELDVRYN